MQYLLDQLVGVLRLLIDQSTHLLAQPPPSLDDDGLLQKLRRRLSELLASLRAGAEGSGHTT